MNCSRLVCDYKEIKESKLLQDLFGSGREMVQKEIDEEKSNYETFLDFYRALNDFTEIGRPSDIIHVLYKIESLITKTEFRFPENCFIHTDILPTLWSNFLNSNDDHISSMYSIIFNHIVKSSEDALSIFLSYEPIGVLIEKMNGCYSIYRSSYYYLLYEIETNLVDFIIFLISQIEFVLSSDFPNNDYNVRGLIIKKILKLFFEFISKHEEHIQALIGHFCELTHNLLQSDLRHLITDDTIKLLCKLVSYGVNLMQDYPDLIQEILEIINDIRMQKSYKYVFNLTQNLLAINSDCDPILRLIPFDRLLQILSISFDDSSELHIGLFLVSNAIMCNSSYVNWFISQDGLNILIKHLNAGFRVHKAITWLLWSLIYSSDFSNYQIILSEQFLEVLIEVFDDPDIDFIVKTVFPAMNSLMKSVVSNGMQNSSPFDEFFQLIHMKFDEILTMNENLDLCIHVQEEKLILFEE